MYAIVRMIDGNEFVGAILSKNTETLVLHTENFGDITLRNALIRSIRLLENSADANLGAWLPSAYTDRYFASQNAYGLRKGEGFYENSWLFFNQVSYGLTDQFSMRLGLAPLILVDGPLPLWLEPKIAIPLRRERLNLAIGGFVGYGFNGNDNGSGSFGALYSQFTLGSRDANVTAGLGLGFAGGNWSRSPVVSLSGLLRTGRKYAFVSENYWFQVDEESTALLSFGCRFMGRYIAIDGALVFFVVPDEGVYPLPWLGVHVPFGRIMD